MNKKKLIKHGAGLLAAAFCLTLLAGAAGAQSLKTIPVPEPFDLFNHVADKNAAIQLGKLLFWDMQVGSDGIQACASCHFHAGADNRFRNQMAPNALGGSNKFFPPDRPNSTLTSNNFPFHKLTNPDDAKSPLARASNPDVCSSQGIKLAQFVDIQLGKAEELSTPLIDPVFSVNSRGRRYNVRRVASRNTPSVINAAFNFSNFWDGRANDIFNGWTPFGPADNDPTTVNFIDDGAGLVFHVERIPTASLASQAVGPPLSEFEMSYRGRTWPKIGKKMLSLAPLAKQVVHPRDSVLGPIAKSTINPVNGQITFVKGVNATYADLIRTAFQSQYWSNTSQMVTYEVDPLDNVVKPKISARPPGPLNTNQYTQMEANFSLFFGLAIQLYEATLIADDCAFDRFLDGFFGSLTSQQQRGLGNYNAAGCAGCHANPETTSASFRLVQAGAPQFPYTPPFGAIELMPTGNRQPAFYDTGFNNTAVTPTANDISRSADTPFPNPAWPGTFYPLCYSDLAMLKRDSKVPSAYSIFIPTLPIGNAVPKDRIANHGAFKVSQLRNIELTGPYQHNGGQATLHQVVDFYTRGGNFADNNLMDLDPAIVPLGGLLGLPGEKNDLVAFLLSMTDQRVKNELAPFDHPELIVPHGVTTNGQEIFFRVPPVGAFGRPAELLPPLQSFLNLNPFLPD